MSWGRDPCNAGWVTGQQPLRERHKTCPDSSPHPPTEQKLWLSEIECAALPVLVKSYCHWDKGTEKSSQLWWQPGICSGPRSTAGVGRTAEKTTPLRPSNTVHAKTESSSEKQRTPCLASSTKPTGIERQRTGWQCGERLSLRLNPKGRPKAGGTDIDF